MTPRGRNLEAMMQQFMENQEQFIEGMKQCAKDNKNLGFKMDSMHDHLQRSNQELYERFINLSNHVKMLEVQVSQITEGSKRQANVLPGKVEENPKFCKVITTKKKDAVSQAPRVQSTSKHQVTRREDDEPISKAPHQRRLKKREDPVKFIFPCTINGIDFIESLCDTGSTVNLMSKIIARKLGIVEMEPPGKMLKFADASSTTPCGFVRDLEMQIGGCLVPTDFHIIEMQDEASMSLILGTSFLTTVGEMFDFRKGQVSFSEIKKKVFYPAVPAETSCCTTIYSEERASLDPGDDIKRSQDVPQEALYIGSYDIFKSAPSAAKLPPEEATLTAKEGALPPKNPKKNEHYPKPKERKKPSELKHKDVFKDLHSVLPPPFDEYEAKEEPDGLPKSLTKIRILLPKGCDPKEDPTAKEKLKNTLRLFPSAFVFKDGMGDDIGVPKPPHEPPGQEKEEAKGILNPLVDAPTN
ncbi:unnamed protein product [Microthlaspi erraticum]|uniref:Aspartic peptidase DDI1-type domain-containing protein n=1 Tax=Microthlaspi erraticum TaxID=1685480 RepID=A0A6D2JBE0_9BRAS|nr:unnamed protein product [Microthlaspi erraticum]